MECLSEQPYTDSGDRCHDCRFDCSLQEKVLQNDSRLAHSIFAAATFFVFIPLSGVSCSFLFSG